MISEQPDPKQNETKPIWNYVIEDMHARDEKGLSRYGVKLQGHNQRNALIDSYEEILDFAVYFKQYIIESEDMKRELKSAIEMLEFGRYDECRKHLEVMRNWAPFKDI